MGLHASYYCAVALVLCLSFCNVLAEPQVPCYFIFGDSLVDNGNNNGIASLARANYFPYGIDFQNGPTGRFSNGLTTVDVISKLLGFEDYIPSYASASGEQILKGVNYASAASRRDWPATGIYFYHSSTPQTGVNILFTSSSGGSNEPEIILQGARIPFSGQVRNYQTTVSQVVNILGDEDQAASYLSKCIYSIGLGSNDYLNNYFMPTYYNTGSRYTTEQYAELLIQDYSRHLRSLYDYGGRKFALISIGHFGCSPNELAQNSQDGTTCVSKINEANKIFNSKLKALVDQFNNDLPDGRAIYINAYDIFQDMIDRPSAFGFTQVKAGCCGVGRNNGEITCLPGQMPCLNRNQYLFWDAFHPTEAANIVVGRRSYSAEAPSDAYPIDIRRLAQI